MIGIYKITSPSGAIYIGQSRNLNKRRYDYSKMRCKSQRYIYHSLLKHGFDAHKFQIIELSPIDVPQNTLDFMEKFYINHFRVLGYEVMNLRDGGTGGGAMPRESIESARLKNTGQKRSEETKAKLREAWKKRQPMSREVREKIRIGSTGKKRSEETKQRMRDAQKGREVSPEEAQRLRTLTIGQSPWNKGKIGGKLKPESIAKRTASRAGYKHSEETKAKIGAANAIALKGKKRKPC